MIKSLKISYYLIIVLLIAGCKSAKIISSNGEINSNLSAKQLIKNNNKNRANFKTLVARLKIDYSRLEESQGATVSLRMEKGKAIWMSKLGIAKILITPTRVAYYNKWDNTYFDEDFKLLSDFVGTELDFNKVQNLLLGEALFSLKDDDYVASTHEGSYLLQPKTQRDLFEVFFLLNPTHFKMDSQQLSQEKEQRMLEIDYKNYQEVEKEILPQNIKIIALESYDETIIDLEFKSVSLNQDIRFPFRIPSGYKEIEIK